METRCNKRYKSLRTEQVMQDLELSNYEVDFN